MQGYRGRRFIFVAPKASVVFVEGEPVVSKSARGVTAGRIKKLVQRTWRGAGRWCLAVGQVSRGSRIRFARDLYFVPWLLTFLSRLGTRIVDQSFSRVSEDTSCMLGKNAINYCIFHFHGGNSFSIHRICQIIREIVSLFDSEVESAS